MVLSGFVERIRASARRKKLQLQKAVSGRGRSSHDRSRGRALNESEIESDTIGKSRSSTLMSDDRSFTTTVSSIASNSIVTANSGSLRHSLATTSDEGEPGSPQNFYGIVKRKPESAQLLPADADYSHASTATLTVDRLNSLESGLQLLLFLEFLFCFVEIRTHAKTGTHFQKRIIVRIAKPRFKILLVFCRGCFSTVSRRNETGRIASRSDREFGENSFALIGRRARFIRQSIPGRVAARIFEIAQRENLYSGYLEK